MNDFILAVYSEEYLGLGVYYDPSILSTEVATSLQYRAIKYDRGLCVCFKQGYFKAPLHLAYIPNYYSSARYLNEKFFYFEKTSNYIKEFTRISATSNLIPEIDSFKLSHRSQFLFR